jgi:hypothetical protein
VKAFLEGDGPGPDLSDLHFDLPAGLKSQWNKEALRLVREKLCQNLLDYLQTDDLPRSEQYFDKIVEERFIRLAGIWRVAQPKELRGGRTENHEDVEERLNGRKDGMLQSYRRFTRRETVGDLLPPSLGPLTIRPIEIRGEAEDSRGGSRAEGRRRGC